MPTRATLPPTTTWAPCCATADSTPLRSATAAALARDTLPRLANDRLGEAKLFVTHHLLALRSAHPALFAEGDYQPLDPGPGWLGFTRSSGAKSLAVILPIGPRAQAQAPALPEAPAGKSWQPVLSDPAADGSLPFDPLFPFVVALAV